MFQYTNGFSCAMDRERTELRIRFLQHSPDFGTDNQLGGMRNEEVASLIMNRDTALRLAEALNQILEEQAPNNIYPIK